MLIKFLSVSVVLMAVATQSNALSIGRATAVATLGRSLVANVPIQLGQGEEIGDSCFEVSVFYGDSRQDSQSIRIEKGTSNGTPGTQFRIESNAPVNEPVVTLYVGVTCGQKTSRRFVFLSDVAPEWDEAKAIKVTPAEQQLLIVQESESSAKRTFNGPLVPLPIKSAQQFATRNNESKVRNVISVGGISTSATLKESTTKPLAKRARLKLVPFDPTEQDPKLKMSDVLSQVPVPELDQRARLQELWMALNATPEENLQQLARLRTLEGDLKALQAATSRNQIALTEVISKLEAERQGRQAANVITGLVSALIVIAGFAFLVWKRRSLNASNSRPWWLGMAAKGPLDLHASDETADVMGITKDAETLHRMPTVQSVVPVGTSEIDIDLDISESLADLDKDLRSEKQEPLPTLPNSSTGGVRDFSQSIHGSLRAINTQEMLDVRQQAEFFVTLGQYDEAIDMLVKTIHGVGDHNPLVYIDLLKLLHSLSRREEFEKYRKEFNGIYTGFVPEYPDFGQDGKDLEAYTQICDSVIDAWHGTDVIQSIEFQLLRQEFGQGDSIDLAAFKDLLMLRGVAIRLTDDVSGFAPFISPRVEPPSIGALPSMTKQTGEVAPAIVDFDLSEPLLPNNDLLDLKL